MTDKRRAGCTERCTSGSEGGVGKQARDHVGQPERPAPTLQMAGAGPIPSGREEVAHRRMPHIVDTNLRFKY